MCLASLLCEQFYLFSNGDIEQVLLHEIFFFFFLSSSSEVLGKITSIRSKLPTTACWPREEKSGNCEATANLTSVSQTPQTNHSQYSSPVEALNLIIDSKSRPFELHVDNSTIPLHVPSRRKKSLQSYCSVDFDFLALMRFDMTFDVTLRNDSGFGKLTNSCACN